MDDLDVQTTVTVANILTAAGKPTDALKISYVEIYPSSPTRGQLFTVHAKVQLSKLSYTTILKLLSPFHLHTGLRSDEQKLMHASQSSVICSYSYGMQVRM